MRFNFIEINKKIKKAGTINKNSGFAIESEINLEVL